MPKDFWQHLGQRIMARTTNKPRRMYPCGKCQKIYSNASSLYRHLKLECGMLPQFHCPYCRFSSKRKFNLDSHVAHKHSKLLNCYEWLHCCRCYGRIASSSSHSHNSNSSNSSSNNNTPARRLGLRHRARRQVRRRGAVSFWRADA
ncbi:oocyte zinc finger protein XlCOF19-like isoform X2 [Apis dorsata]|uniref:oocyte zinc finger protein XlCOF19-like isoform X2 n=1 Tax=Apis dorsata TaxID=7462 RepID=UPI0012936BD4|nr:oocyte zinc finger protein XlCOF19-like isoform X2 [Apis dorsata]